MPRSLPLRLFIAAAFTATAIAGHTANGNRHVIDSLRTELTSAHTTADSIPILCNLYDALPIGRSTPLGDSIYHIAMRAGDTRTALDIIRDQAGRYMTNDSALKSLTAWALRCPDGNDRKETLTYIRMTSNIRRASYGDSRDREEALKEFIEEIGTNNHTDLYDRIAITHGICMMLYNEPNGKLLTTYLDSLGRLINRLPATAYSLRNAYYAHVATVYATSDPQKSVAADMNTLSDIDNLERYYRNRGRVFRNYHETYYTIYTRLLSNYAVLDSAKVEEYYNKALAELQYDPAIRADYTKTPLPDIYYAMFHKDYRRVLPLITEALESPQSKRQRMTMMRFVIECARQLGYKSTQLKATTDYAEALQSELDERASSSYRELQTAYTMYDMKYRMEQMEIEKSEADASMQRAISIAAISILVVLTILVAFLSVQYRRNRQLTRNLANANERLVSESESLKQSRAELIRARDIAQKANNMKSDFIKNMSCEVRVPLQAINEYSHLIADCADYAPDNTDSGQKSSSKHLARFADLIEHNSELLSTIVEDVLRLSEIESESMPIYPKVINVKSLCEATIESIRHRVKPGVELTLDPACQPMDLYTDPTRVQQILNNMLTNAAKFTEHGSITLSYKHDESTGNAVFTVTDTGIGINPDNKERIFERFVKLDHNTQGAGLGLTISRLIARMLGGDLYLDTSHTPGSRFVFSIPKK